MDDFLGIILLRTLVRIIGQYTRYFLFWLIGKKRPLKSLSNISKNEYKDLGNALSQDFLNALIGSIVLGTIVLIIVAMVFG